MDVDTSGVSRGVIDGAARMSWSKLPINVELGGSQTSLLTAGVGTFRLLLGRFSLVSEPLGSACSILGLVDWTVELEGPSAWSKCWACSSMSQACLSSEDIAGRLSLSCS